MIHLVPFSRQVVNLQGQMGTSLIYMNHVKHTDHSDDKKEIDGLGPVIVHGQIFDRD